MSSKVTALTELASQPANGDLFYIVDVSDTTDDPAGTSKRLTTSRIIDRARNIVLGEEITIDGLMEIKKSATDVQFDFLANTAGIALDVRNLADQNIFQIEGDTGNVNIPVGDLSVSNGSVSCDGVAVSSGNNITIGSISIESVANSIDLGAASTLAIRDSANANLLTVEEATGNVEVVSGNLNVPAGNIVVDTLSIENGGYIDLATASNLTIRNNSNTILISIDEANGNLIVNNGALRAYGTGFEVSGPSDFLDDVNMNNNSISSINTLATSGIATIGTDLFVGQNITSSFGDITASNGEMTADQFNQSANSTPPANASDTGTEGEIRFDGSYIYYCSAANTWVRAALAAW